MRGKVTGKVGCAPHSADSAMHTVHKCVLPSPAAANRCASCRARSPGKCQDRDEARGDAWLCGVCVRGPPSVSFIFPSLSLGSQEREATAKFFKSAAVRLPRTLVLTHRMHCVVLLLCGLAGWPWAPSACASSHASHFPA